MAAGAEAGALPRLPELRRAALAWARSDGTTWIYMAKVVLAGLLTYWIALQLELPQPSTAIVTVFIVMQPQSGQVFAKGFYRMAGSLVGLSVMVALIALFAQERVMFLVAAAIWIGLCTFGAARFRDFRSYACMLAGYSATLIGLPAAVNPEGAFMQAVWRILEIGLGIFVASCVSALILPRSSGAAMRDAVSRRFGAFAAFVLDHLDGGDRRRFEAANFNFAAQAVGLEALRSASVFDDPHMRLRSGRLARINNEFMALTTRYHALHQLLERLRSQPSPIVLAAFEPCLRELRAQLARYRERALTEADAGLLAGELEALRPRLMQAIRDARATLADEAGLLDFDTAAELLYRFASELHDHALTHASLVDDRHAREQRHGFATQANALAALVAGARTALMVFVFGLFWIWTAWPSGSTFVLNAVAIAALVSASPNPARAAAQMAVGTFYASVLGFSVGIFVLPHLDGFPMLCLALAPVFALGAFLSVRPATAGYGAAILIFFSVGAVPANQAVYDPGSMLNNYISLILSQSMAAAMVGVVLPTRSPWLWRRLGNDLRMRVVQAIDDRRPDLAASFESGTRDLLNQAYGIAANRPDVQQRLLGWTFVVLEVGHAILELRREQDALPDEAQYAEATPWRHAIRTMGRALIRLFMQPEESNRERALQAVEHAMDAVRATEEPRSPHFESSPLRRVLSYLHFIRTTLLDPASPLWERAPGTGAATDAV